MADNTGYVTGVSRMVMYYKADIIVPTWLQESIAGFSRALQCDSSRDIGLYSRPAQTHWNGAPTKCHLGFPSGRWSDSSAVQRGPQTFHPEIPQTSSCSTFQVVN